MHQKKHKGAFLVATTEREESKKGLRLLCTAHYPNTYTQDLISEDKPPEPCPNGWSSPKENGLCYNYVDSSFSNWEAARDHCGKLGGDLATIPDLETQNSLTTLIPNGKLCSSIFFSV